MKTICIHWTGGNYNPNSIDLAHYHFLITNTGEVIKGNYSNVENFEEMTGDDRQLHVTDKERDNTRRVQIRYRR